MRATIVAPLLLLVASALPAKAREYREPKVQIHNGVLPASICKHLIDLGEESGFDIEWESIDSNEQKEAKKDPNKKFVPAQTIDVYNKYGYASRKSEVVIDNEDIWNVLKPYLPKLANLVKDSRDKEAFTKLFPNDPDKEPELNWVFFRKYSPKDERNSLKMHHDTNMFTLNIELSNDYEGGGWFYVKPYVSSGNAFIPKEYYSGYEWLNQMKRENTTDLVFPALYAGDAVLYNYTVHHAVAPVESGTRYSMAFFYHMDNPAVKGHFDSSDDYDDSSDLEDSSDFDSEDESDTTNDDDFTVEVKNALHNTELDIVLVYDGGTKEKVWEKIFKSVPSNVTAIMKAYEGDLIRALVAGTDEFVSDIEIKREKSMYAISQINSLNDVEL